MGNVLKANKLNFIKGTSIKTVKKRISTPFLIKPRDEIQKTGSYTTSHLEKGHDYHSIFLEKPGLKIIWNLEKEALKKIALERGPFNLLLDFASGTGRIASVLEPYTKQLILLDISKKMLSVAEQNLPKSIIVNQDFRKGLNEVEDGCLEVATAFRFFPNAEDHLRRDAMAFMSNKLKIGGLLICNNHRNFWSIPYIASRLLCRGGDVGMTNKQLLVLAHNNRFRLLKAYSMGLIPQSETRALLPWKVVELIERFLFRLIGTKQTCGYNVIFLFERY